MKAKEKRGEKIREGEKKGREREKREEKREERMRDTLSSGVSKFPRGITKIVSFSHVTTLSFCSVAN